MSTDHDQSLHDRVGDEIFQGELPAGASDREIADLEALWSVLGQTEPVAPSAELSDGLRGRLDDAASSAPSHGLPGGGGARWFRTSAPWLKAAAVVALAGGSALGWVLTRGGGGPVVSAGERDLAASLVSVLDSPGSTPARLAAVGGAYAVEGVASEAIDALVEIARTDPSVGVRVAAIDALAWLADRSAARAALGTLPSQDSPLVQMALLENMVGAAQEPAPVERLLERLDLRPEVRARANEVLVDLKGSQ